MAKTTDIDPSADSYERQFAVIDRNLSEAFDDKKSSNEIEAGDALVLARNEYHFAHSESGETGNSGVIRGNESKEEIATGIGDNPDGKKTSGLFSESNSSRYQDGLDYFGYGANDSQEGVSSNNSESNLSESRSSSPSATPEPWSALNPTDSLGDFEKELLLIKDRYRENSNAKQDSTVAVRAVNNQDSDTKIQTKVDDQ